MRFNEHLYYLNYVLSMKSDLQCSERSWSAVTCGKGHLPLRLCPRGRRGASARQLA